MLQDTIKAIRKKNYLNQTDFANRVGVTQGAVSQWECGMTRPNMDQLKAISMEFGVSIDDMLVGEDVSDQSISKMPHTPEAQILAKGIDRLPKEQREQALNVVKAMFNQYADYFDKENADEP